MEKEEFESLLKAHLDPLHRAIEKLEEQQEKIVAILAEQARQDEAIKHIRLDMEKCATGQNEIFNRLRTIEAESGNKLWDILRVIFAAFIAGAIGLFVGREAK